ncbi:MAG: DivIVA domain-containing protein [Bacilli bacterium]|nr:DivIVA domain-containing protein [Bacilli bacterium]
MAGKINFNSITLCDLKFAKNVKGYDAYQVDVALDRVIDDYHFYENFYKEAKDYIAKLESDVKKLRDETRKKDIEIARINKRIEGIKDKTNVSSENIDLLQRINALEKALYAKGIDPTKIR